jgi:hypothetical protein
MIYILYLLISILYIIILIIYIIYNDILLQNTIYKKQLYVPLLNNDIDFQDL